MSILDDLVAERARYGANMNDDECVDMINAVAWKNRNDGWGLNYKDFGTHGTRFDGVKVAHDVLHHAPTNILYDVLIGAGAQSTPTFNTLGPNTNTSRPWVAPVAPRGETIPTPVPPAPPAPQAGEYQDELDDLKAQLSRVQEAIEGVPSAVVAEIVDDIQDAVQAAVEQEIAKTVSDPVVRDGISESVRRALKSQTYSARNRFLGTITLVPNE